MKKTLNINLGGVPFIIDEDAYDSLKKYLAEIEIRLDLTDDKEILEDIESRIADIFKESIHTPSSQVVSLTLVNRSIAIIGTANEFGEPKRPFTVNSTQSVRQKRLYRSRNEKMLGGVCGGMANYLDIDPTLMRVIAFILLIPGGLSLFAYIALWIIIPLEPRSPRTGSTYNYNE